MNVTHDLIAVGAGFAGLACAKRTAESGPSVLVIEKQPPPDRYVHTTGILVKEAQEQWAAPTTRVRELNRIRLYAPSHRSIELRADDWGHPQELSIWRGGGRRDIADYLTGDAPNPGDAIRASYEDYAWNYFARWCFDSLPLSWCMELGLISGSLFQRVVD